MNAPAKVVPIAGRRARPKRREEPAGDPALRRRVAELEQQLQDWQRAEPGESLLVAALSVAAIAYPKTRQFGAGLLLGIAIATVIWSGLCALIGTGL